jgi:hypothetical protein
MKSFALRKVMRLRHCCRRMTAIPALVVVLSGLLLLEPATAWGQKNASDEPPDRQIDTEFQAEVIDSVAAALNEIYVFPDMAKEMEKHLRKQFKKKAYQDITSCRDFTRKLTEDLQEISKDRHLRVMFASDEMIESFVEDTLTDEAKEHELRENRRDNFGFMTVKLLEGNVGYLDFRLFSEASDAGATAVAAMNFLAYADAIIFDLRQNGGGSPSMIQLISSYLLDEPTHLNSFYIRKEDTTKQFWTQAWVDGPRMSEALVYVLTSKNTFSGAEEFTYNLKNLKRGTIIGETTGGGAHPVDGRIFANLNVGMSLPFGRAINPITGTNWEGTGVTPDIEVPQEKALDVAHLEALKALIEKADDPDIKRQLDWAIESKKAVLEPYTPPEGVLQDYVGVYGPRRIWMEGEELYYQRGENPRYMLTPMAADKFMIPELDYFRLEFVRDDEGKVVKVVGLYDNGMTDAHERDN